MTPRWLKITDAARYSAIGKKRLIELARKGQIRGAQDPGDKRNPWIFDRRSLDDYRDRLMEKKDTARARALEIMRTM